MVLWEIRSYPAALERERARVLALTGLQDTYGVLAWRWRAPRRVRALYRLGEHGVTPDATPAGSAGCREVPAAAYDDPGAGVRARIAAVRAARTPALDGGPGGTAPGCPYGAARWTATPWSPRSPMRSATRSRPGSGGARITRR